MTQRGGSCESRTAAGLPVFALLRAWPFTRWLPLAAALLLAACAAAPAQIAPGTPRAAVAAQLGTPYSVSPLPGGGESWLYTTYPMGFYAYHVDLDPAGRVARTEQVLTFERFAAIPVGRFTAADVRATFGPPFVVERVSRFNGDVWTYRFIADINLRRLAHVHIDPAGVVRHVMFTDEPMPGDRRAF